MGSQARRGYEGGDVNKWTLIAYACRLAFQQNSKMG